MATTRIINESEKRAILNVYRELRYDEIQCAGTNRASYFEKIKSIFHDETYAIDSAIYADINRSRLNARKNAIVEELKRENRSESHLSIEVLREMCDIFKSVDEVKNIRLLSFITKIEDNYSHKSHSAGGSCGLSSSIHIHLSTEDIQLLSEILYGLLE